jgi:CBS domain containing-hemolysin-like protein
MEAEKYSYAEALRWLAAKYNIEIEETEEIEGKGFFTLGGLVLYIAKNIPKASEKFTWKNYFLVKGIQKCWILLKLKMANSSLPGLLWKKASIASG